jgi:hypothetical protein
MKATEFVDARPPEAFEDSSPSAVIEEESPRGAWSEELDINPWADSALTLPGKGDRGDNCGNWYPKQFCDECGEPKFGQSSCLQRSCPDCWGKWANDRTTKIVERVQAARYAAPDGMERRAIHGVVSPPEGEIKSLTDIRQGFKTAYSKAKTAGIRGGVMMFHGWRANKKAKRKCPDDEKIWRWIRESGRWRDYVKWSPHYHIIGLATEVESSDDEWIIERVRTFDRFRLSDVESYEDIAKTAQYVMSHLSIEMDGSSPHIRWYGSLSTSSFRVDEELSDGTQSIINRLAKEATESDSEPTESGANDAPDDECINCGATSFSSIYQAGAALADKEWCKRIGREQQRKLSVAFEWMIGDVRPPPGLKNPQSEEESREAFQHLIENSGRGYEKVE